MSEENKNEGKKIQSEPKKHSLDEETRLRGIWSKAMALRGLKKVMNVSLEAAKIPTLNENGEVVEVKFNPSAANAATKAIETANKMLGYNLPDDDSDECDTEITVIFENAEEYSL